MLQKITLPYKSQTIEMVNPFTGSGQYHIYIDRIYQGQLACKNGVWENHLNDYCELETADIDLLCEAWRERWG